MIILIDMTLSLINRHRVEIQGVCTGKLSYQHIHEQNTY